MGKGLLAILMGSKKPAGNTDENGDASDSSKNAGGNKADLAKALLEAIHNNDHDAVADALESFVDDCNSDDDGDG